MTWHQTRDGNWAGPDGARVIVARQYLGGEIRERYVPEVGGVRGCYERKLGYAQNAAERMARRAAS